jgi:hypothetical protein
MQMRLHAHQSLMAPSAFVKLLLPLLVGLLCLALFSGPVMAQPSPVNQGELRVVNALVGIGPVDVYLNNERIASALSPESATAYFVRTAGQHNVAVRLPGADPLSAPVADILVSLSPNQSLSAVVYQKHFATETHTPPFEQSGAFVVLDDDRSPLTLGQTRLTALHLAPNVSGVLNIGYPSGEALLQGLRYEAPYGTIDIEAGVYPLAVLDPEADNRSIQLIGQTVFRGNTLYTVFIVPDLAPLPSTATRPGSLTAGVRLFILSAAQDAPEDGLHLRVIHAAHNTAVVDVYIDERLVLPRFNYANFSEYLGLQGYSHTLTLRRRDASPTAEPLATAHIRLNEENQSQKHWTLLLLNAGQEVPEALVLDDPNPAIENVIINTPGGAMLLALVPDNVAQTPTGLARVRLLHAVDGALPVSLYTPALPTPEPSVTPVAAPAITPTPAPPVQLIQGVVYGAEAGEGEAPEGNYILNFNAGGAAEIVSLTDVSLVKGLVYTYVLVGLPAGEPPIRVLALTDYGRGIPQERLYRGIIAPSQTTDVNIRAYPNADVSNVIARLQVNTEVEVLGRNFNGDWVAIRFVNPTTNITQDGWISAALIQVTRLGDAINILSLPEVN